MTDKDPDDRHPEDIEIIIHEPGDIAFARDNEKYSDHTVTEIAPANRHPSRHRIVQGNRRISLVYKDPQFPARIEAPGFFRITPEMSVLHSGHIKKLHHRTPQLTMRIIDKGGDWDLIFGIWSDAECPFEVAHLIGRIDLTLTLLDMGIKRIHWAFPEAGLHPAWQTEIGDLLIHLTEETNE